MLTVRGNIKVTGNLNLKTALTSAPAGLVTDGLILNLDSTDTNSYPGSGTSWDDLTSEGNDFTLVNGPTFSTDDGGTIVTDGANDYIKSDGNIDEVNEANSTFAYVKCTDLTNGNWASQYLNHFLAKGWNNSSKANIVLRFYATTSNWGTYGYASLSILIRNSSGTLLTNWNGWDETTVPQIEEDEWYYVGFTTDGGSGDDVDAFVNGVKVGTGTLSGARGTISDQPLVVGNDSWGRSFGTAGSNRNYHMYSRKLTDAEVLQNYNAIKI
jgi:hypothetical protein